MSAPEKQRLQPVLEALRGQFGDAIVEELWPYGDLTIVVAKDKLRALLGDGMAIGTADPAGNNTGGAPGPWRNIGDPLDPTFVFTLGAGFFPLLADGSFTVSGTNNNMEKWGSNRAILTITTEDTPAENVPEPGTLTLFGLGLAGLGFARRRKAM